MFMILSGTAAGSLVLLLWRFEEKSPWLVDEGKPGEKMLRTIAPGTDLEEVQ